MEWVLLVCFSYSLHGDFWFDAFFWRSRKSDSNLATEIISADGVVLGKYFEKQVSITLCWFTKKFSTSTNCYRRCSFFMSILVLMAEELWEPFQFRTSGGASTLTQQFAKQLLRRRF
jgi:penicillin-binding protein 1A